MATAQEIWNIFLKEIPTALWSKVYNTFDQRFQRKGGYATLSASEVQDILQHTPGVPTLAKAVRSVLKTKDTKTLQTLHYYATAGWAPTLVWGTLFESPDMLRSFEQKYKEMHQILRPHPANIEDAKLSGNLQAALNNLDINFAESFGLSEKEAMEILSETRKILYQVPERYYFRDVPALVLRVMVKQGYLTVNTPNYRVTKRALENMLL